MLFELQLYDKFGFDGTTYKEKFAEVDWDKFAAHWPLAGTFSNENPPESLHAIDEGPASLTDVQAQVLSDMGFKLKFVPYPGAMVTKMADRKDWDFREEPTFEDVKDSKVVHIAIPDLNLMMIGQVEVLVDCCTDELNNWLKGGWRILAVCPPNAQRRPDYVLGKTPDKDTH